MQTQAEDRKLDGVSKENRSCMSCIHMQSCKFYETMLIMANKFNGEAKTLEGKDQIVVFPFPPEAIAKNCKLYQSPVGELLEQTTTA